MKKPTLQDWKTELIESIYVSLELERAEVVLDELLEVHKELVIQEYIEELKKQSKGS